MKKALDRIPGRRYSGAMIKNETQSAEGNEMSEHAHEIDINDANDPSAKADPFKMMLDPTYIERWRDAHPAAVAAQAAADEKHAEEKRAQIEWERTHKTCPKCGGSGYLAHYHHVSKGVCFTCFGSGVVGA